MRLLLRLLGCSDELGYDIDCIKRVCNSRLGPDGKLVLLACILDEAGVLPAPIGVEFADVVCEDNGDEVVIRVVAKEGVYELACRNIGAKLVCRPLPHKNVDIA